MNYYQGISNYNQPISSNQTIQGHSVIYAEPVIHEPTMHPNQKNVNGYYGNPADYRIFPSYNYYSSSDNRTTLNPNMFQPVMPSLDQMNLQHFKQTNNPAQPKQQQPQYENQSTIQNQQQVTNEELSQANVGNSSMYGNPPNQQAPHAIYPNHAYQTHGVNSPNQQPVSNANQPIDPYFINPLQHQANVNHPMYNPYPKMKILPKQQSTSSSILSSFKNPDGKYDIVSVVNTAGQMVNVVNQVGSIFKGIGGIFKV